MRLETFRRYVDRRLDRWGREFALDRDVEILGHFSKDRLQILREHRGEMPPRVVGFKPLEIPPLEQQIEDIVAAIAKQSIVQACVLRAYYCGSGRRGVERLETARELLSRCDAGVVHLSRATYYRELDAGFDAVCVALASIASEGRAA